MSKLIAFRVHGLTKNGAGRQKTFTKINHALRYMWRTKEVKELYLEVFEGLNSSYCLFAKIGRRRAINSHYVSVPDSWPAYAKMPELRYMPNKFNDI